MTWIESLLSYAWRTEHVDLHPAGRIRADWRCIWKVSRHSRLLDLTAVGIAMTGHIG